LGGDGAYAFAVVFDGVAHMAAMERRRLLLFTNVSNPMYTSFFPSFIALEGCASQPIQAQESPHRHVTTRIISPCWFLEGGPQHEDGGGISGSGTGSSGNNEGDELMSAGMNDNAVVVAVAVDVTGAFLLLQQLLTGSGVTCAIGVVGVDGAGVDGDEDDGGGLLLLQQPLDSDILGARGRSDSSFFLFLGAAAVSDAVAEDVCLRPALKRVLHWGLSLALYHRHRHHPPPLALAGSLGIAYN